MNRAIGLWVLGILLLAGHDPARAAGPADAVRSLPQAMQDRIAADPAAFARKLAFLAASYGEKGNLSVAALDRMAATIRARARAGETARLMAADLDGDGAISGDERRMALAALSAPRQKRLETAWAEADADEDGQVSATELAQQATAAGQRAMSPERLAEWKALMGLDADADGQLTTAEIAAALALPADKPPGGVAVAEPPADETADPAGG